MRIPRPHIYIVDNLQIITILQANEILYLLHQDLASNVQEKRSNGEKKILLNMFE